MDVRCEKCLTVYELDDAKVGDAGLTVKCQECGNLFKVRRRHNTAELVAPVQSSTPARPEVGTSPAGAPSASPAAAPPSAPPSALGTPLVPKAVAPVGQPATASDDELTVRAPKLSDPAAERTWMLRSAKTGQVSRFRELTTLQQWIVERKVTREDEISRGGESWKELGGIAELASFFHVVEQAEAVAHSSQPGLAMQRSAIERGDPPGIGQMPTEMLPAKRARVAAAGEETFATGPTQLGDLIRGDSGTGRIGPAADGLIGDDSGAETIVGGRAGVRRYLEDFADEGSPRRARGSGPALLLGAFVVVAAVGGGAYFLRSKQPPADPQPSAEAVELVQRGRAAFLSDTDDGFRQAISALDRALELDAASITARVELGETHVTWAAYLLEDARRLEVSAGAAGAQAARTLRAEARTHLERARRVLEEPAGAEAASAPTGSPALARAFADLLRVEGAPAAQVERYLNAAAQRSQPSGQDPELAFVAGELALREGKTQDASTRLAEAAQGRGGVPPLVRAVYRLAAIAQQNGQQEELRRRCEQLQTIASRHDRARALCGSSAATVDLGAVRADLGAAAATTTAVATTTTTPPTTTPTPPSTSPKGRDASLAPPVPAGDYKSLVREADRLSENGKSQQARKLYERALELDGKGVAALTGLGYCDLDAERYLQAVDRFNAALSIDASSGDAILGLAESYKVRGQTAKAIEHYKKYLSAHPTGPKAQMAQKNLRDLEPRPVAKEPKEPKEPAEKEPERAEPKREEPALPRPPQEPPP
jgi:predicted Zn finger-like uncharacterized protein